MRLSFKNISIAARRTVWRIIAATILLLAVALLLDKVICPLPRENLFKPSAQFVYARDKSLLSAYPARDSYWRKPVKLSEISPLLIQSLIAREDRYFYYHPGVNLFSVVTAAFDNIRAGKVVRGGSTITMQVARMMEPKSRTLKAKLIEIARAFQLELHFSKKEILELYFNLAPYGGNIEGVGAAAYFYFGKTPIELSASQAALLTSIPNSPTNLRPDINLNKSLAARDRVLEVMRQRKIISDAAYNEALHEEIRSRKTDPPNSTPHFSRDLAATFPSQIEIFSTIEPQIQNICDGIIANHKNDLQMRGINNAALVVINNYSAEILAMVGSTDYDDITHQGQVNGATSPRSPGSALKPFVYAMALDSGLISPASLVEDLPIYYSGYSPENYDRQFRGAVSAAEALRLSLNIPAVELCSQVGQKDFYRLLKSGGISTLFRKEYEYGLPIILGACEIKLLDLATLYSSFSRDGKYLPYKTTLTNSAADTILLFSPAASYIISEILSELERPDFPASWEFSPNIPKVAWKTGTSYGRKDAWSLGYNPEYTIGVWVGNFDGTPSADLVGADAAAPILFDVFSAIGSGRDAGWFSQPQTVGTRMVCSISGAIPNEFCPATISETYIPGVSPAAECKIHRQILVDLISGYRLCRYCAQKKKTEFRTIENWPPKVATWLARAGKMIIATPPHNSDCTGTAHGDRPQIISPVPDVTYIVRKHIPLKEQEIVFEASLAASAHETFWFIDGELFRKTSAGEKVFYEPRPGIHKIVCSDEDGRSSSVIVTIQ